ncbi:MAG: hypothetical protein IIA72_14210 [Proteobacteria bacterium]|nr:hypothetical protein [Pseudomonadota bacterium]
MDKDKPWALYARIQRQADSKILSDQAWARDEALDAILDQIEWGRMVSTEQAENLITNRASKHRQRRRSLAQNTQIFHTTVNENSRLEALCDLGRHQRQCSKLEWRILVSIGLGHTYGRIADAEKVPEATVKTWVRRARLRLAA